MIEAVKQFGDEEAAEDMFIEARWPNGVACPKCGSLNIQERPTRKPQPFRCRDCRKDFSVKTNTVMQGSNIPLYKCQGRRDIRPCGVDVQRLCQ